MRRTKLVVAVGFVMVAMLSLTAGPAMADELDHFDIDEFDFDFDEDVDVEVEEFDVDVETVEREFFVEELPFVEGTPEFEQVCDPNLAAGVLLRDCHFSDPLVQEIPVLVVEDLEFDVEEEDDEDFFDDDDDDDDDHNKFRKRH